MLVLYCFHAYIAVARNEEEFAVICHTLRKRYFDIDITQVNTEGTVPVLTLLIFIFLPNQFYKKVYSLLDCNISPY